MSKIELKVPSPGESISEVIIANWLVKDGDYVENGQVIAEIDSDKATLELAAEASGTISIQAAAGDTVAVGAIAAIIDTSAAKPAGAPAAPAKAAEKKEEKKAEPVKAEAAPNPMPVAAKAGYAAGTPSVSAAKIMAENNIAASQVNGTGPGGRITKGDVLSAMASGFPTESVSRHSGARTERREKMTNLRKKISERLVSVKNNTAMLTTFNEVNMKPIMDLRTKYKDVFKEKHGVGLGFMSFFTKACSEALFAFPAVNARIEGGEIVYHDYTDIGIAVSSPKGLMVPIVRNVEIMGLADIESNIGSLAKKVRDGKITVDEMQGGTFTITNGGVFGSMLSTPIINPPQSAILGMHNIVERPIAENGQVVIRPIMYVALSYDHRIIDGRESVSFLVKVKDMLENPERMLFGGKTAEEVLLGL
ncbi:MAG: 2-oxoglutarate dehydrogenase complex dihydrolipoyllysine-residue succinyltransferase [Flavobacteriales bacterium]|nr:2-oxoglutarate dehydrogenase complex dihydrolipoyllysine-residue succinyltransferase [Flavobacteriales bacterium]